MKRIIVAMAAIVAAFTMASCNKELVEPENNPTEGNCIITASTESNLTKTSLDGDDTNGYDVVWSEDDQIKLGGNTFTLIEGANTTTGKFQGTLPEGDGPFDAYYPADYNGTDWPAEQTYIEGNITGSPMIAEVVKGAESLSFKNKGGILRLTLKGTATVKYIKVSATDLNEITLDCSSVTLNETTGVAFHIAIPEGEYSNVKISIYTPNYDYCTKKLKDGTKLNIVRSQITTASFTAEFPSPTSTDPLPGAFSIADEKQILFSKGNLYYDGSFKFESKQYSFHGYDTGVTWGLFGWSTNDKYGKSTSTSAGNYSGDFVEWGTKIDGTWRTLTSAEWTYLFEGRTDAKDKYGYATVGGKEGLIILPDEFTDPMKNGGSKAFAPGTSTGYETNVYGVGGNWEAMEVAGAVFLPAAGRRSGDSIMYVGDYGFYWSSSASGTDNAYYVELSGSSVKPAFASDRFFGCSVRLVSDLYTVTFDMNGKEGTAPESIKEVKRGSKITKPSDPTTIIGYEFAGWYKDKACTTLWDFDTDVVTENITIFAGWIKLPDGALPDKFSVSADKQVHFSQGNLYWDGSAFQFEANQYSGASYATNHISHFYWSKYASAAYAPNYSDSGSGSDVFFTNATETTPNQSFTVNGVTGKYRALSTKEWQYLFNTRTMTNGKTRYSDHTNTNGIRIEGQNYMGVFLYPDDYNGDVVSSTMTWEQINAAGIVFLPAAGFREDSSIKYASEFGYYWSSSASGSDNAYYVRFYFNHVEPDNIANRYGGFSVRLITESK